MRLFVVYAVVELVALTAVVSWLGFGPTLMVLLAGALLGMWLVRREGSRAALAVADAVRAGRVAHAELTDGALIGLAGLLIMVPGLVSDLLGLLLVLPPSRALARRWLTRQAERRSPLLRTAHIRTGGPVVDGSVVDGSVVGGQVVDFRVVDVRVVDVRPAPSDRPAPPTSRPAVEG
jgi:UPF0716 protein FxsA